MIFRLVVQIALWLGAAGLVLFLAAGDTSWAAGWGFLGVLGVLGLSAGLWLSWRSPDLLSDRLTLPWQWLRANRDIRPMAGRAAVVAIWLAIMALDAGRFRFSQMPQSLQGVGVLTLAASIGGSALAFVNGGVAARPGSIQSGRTVMTEGLYAIVRHPMCAAAMLFFVGAPLLLGSWVGLAVAPAFVAALALRALGEERVLQADQPDYHGYAARVRYRFVPGIW